MTMAASTDAATAGWRARVVAAVRNRVALNLKDGSVMVYVPAGRFEMGDGRDRDCPVRPVTLSAYWIGVFPVTNTQYRRFVLDSGHRAPDHSSWRTPVWHGKDFPTEMADHPVVGVSWADAVAYARWAGGDLPTEAQWERAARGPQGLAFPWGETWEPGRARADKSRRTGMTAPVYAMPAGVSVTGTYDQSGNVWEWCADWYAGETYTGSDQVDPRGPSSGTHRARRGGCWRDDVPSVFRGANRDGSVPDRRHVDLGFRIARAAG